MKITKEHVGKKVITENHTYFTWVEVLYIYPNGETFAGITSEGDADTFCCDGCNPWRLYQEPKPKKLVALALVKDTAGWFIPDKLYSSLETIQSDFTLSDKIVWPAVPNAQGFYEVEE
jgi:hypothetical protein